jgi:hypothetical protein
VDRLIHVVTAAAAFMVMSGSCQKFLFFALRFVHLFNELTVFFVEVFFFEQTVFIKTVGVHTVS